MRRWTRSAAVVVVVSSLVLAGCSRREDTEQASSDELCPAGGDGPKIGLAYDVGGRGDDSFNDLAAKGVSDAVEALDATCTELEAAAEESESAREERLRTLADAGHDPIIGVGAAYATSAATVAAEYPDLTFGVVDGFTEAPNLTNLTFAAQQGAYLVGMAAALETETDNIGFVGGANNPVITTFLAGYQAGARSINPDIEIQTQYLSDELDDTAFSNVPGGRTAAEAMYDNGADVVFHAAGESGNGVFQAADESDNWAIGVDSDQWLGAPEEQQDNILTSSLKRVDVAVLDFVRAFDEGTVEPGFELYDAARDGVGYATSGGHVDEYTDQLDEALAGIIAGEIEVPSEPTS